MYDFLITYGKLWCLEAIGWVLPVWMWEIPCSSSTKWCHGLLHLLEFTNIVDSGFDDVGLIHMLSSSRLFQNCIHTAKFKCHIKIMTQLMFEYFIAFRFFGYYFIILFPRKCLIKEKELNAIRTTRSTCVTN